METNMDKLYFSWDEYYQLIDKLALQLLPLVKEGKSNQIISLARGGSIIGDALSRKFNLPLAVMFTSSYTGNQRQGLIICEDIAKQYNTLGDKILVVDDLLDSGVTLKAVQEYLQNKYQSQVLTAVLWKKVCSPFDADFQVHIMPADAWIVQPFETVEKMV